jgi:Lrp/AsnC family transcriptional regulator for asnA, asnC and gidA
MIMPDSTDEQLVRLLARNARQNSETLAKQLNLSAATVRRRLRKLIQSETLHIIGVVDPIKFGLPVAVIINLDIASEKIVSVMETLTNRPEIRWISTTTGRFDIIALARFASNDDLSNFLVQGLPKIEGVRDSETFICLNMEKGRYIPLLPV